MWKLQGSNEQRQKTGRRGSFRSAAGSSGVIALVLATGLAAAGSAGQAEPLRLAQLGPNPGAGPSYGYQPYDDRNPTGFYHPNGTGYGHYYLTQKYHAPRFRTFRYRKFRGS